MGCTKSKDKFKEWDNKILKLESLITKLTQRKDELEKLVSSTTTKDHCEIEEVKSQLSQRLLKLEAMLEDVKNIKSSRSSVQSSFKKQYKTSSKYTTQVKSAAETPRVKEELQMINGVSVIDDPLVKKLIQEKRNRLRQVTENN